MPRTGSPYDWDWAESLKGLILQVPGNWWDGCGGDDNVYEGKIVAIDRDENNGRHFQFQLYNEEGNEDGDPWPMRYDGVVHYADISQPNFDRFNLP